MHILFYINDTEIPINYHLISNSQIYGEEKKDKLKEVRKELETGDIFEPIDITKLGSGNDPCFGKNYDLSTKECKMCGDSELCCIKFTALMGKTRKELEAETKFKDLEPLVDIEGCKSITVNW